MKQFLILSLIIIGLFQSKLVLGQEKSAPNVLFRLGERGYSLSEFEYYFLKNSERPDKATAKTKVNEYLKLYINFRLKVQAAFELDMHKEEDFIQEFEGYKNQLIEPYLTSSKIVEEQVQEAYDRLLLEVSGSHILLNVEPNASPEDTLKVYNQLLAYKDRVEKGEDFGEIATKFSHDRSAVKNKGYLGYFTALQMVYPFENAIYNHEVGDLVGPFKTRFGYHLLRVEDKRPARGQALTAHIMIRFAEDSMAQQKAESKIQSIYQNLKQGKDWNEQCRLYSDDKNTAAKGGELSWFGTGNLVPEFENVAFAMDSIGSISAPVKTRFGWHIIKLLDKKGVPELAEKRADIEKKIARDSRSSIKKSTALAQLKSKHNYSINLISRDIAFDIIDATLLEAKWELDSSISGLQEPLFSLTDQDFTVNDFCKYVVVNQKKRISTSLLEYKKQLYNAFEENSILDYERNQIVLYNEDYKMVLDEYQSGILLFNLMEKNVWNKAVQDTTGLKDFYDNNKSNYAIDEHLIGRKFIVSDTMVFHKLKNMLELSNSQLDSAFNSKEPLTLQATDVRVLKKENSFLDQHWQVGNHIESNKSYFTMWSVTEIRDKGFKKLKEIKGLVISDYQNELEQRWLKELKTEYPVKISKPLLKNYIKSFE